MDAKISIGIGSANILDLREVLARIDASNAAYVHFDIMDGLFVPNLTYGPKMVKDLREASKKQFDVHLMVMRQTEIIAQASDAGADIITVQAESENPVGSMKIAKALGVRAGISVNLGTKIEKIKPALEHADRIQIMTAATGYAAQPFMEKALDKIGWVRAQGFAGEVAADGGMAPETARACLKAGADVIVSGSWILRQANINEAIAELGG